MNPKTRIDYMFYGGSATKANLAVRFRNRSTYNILGIGTHYFGLDEKFSGALFYRIGQYFQLSPKFSLSGDLGFYHVESFQEHSQDKPERLYSLQARINADYQLGRYTSVFASVAMGIPIIIMVQVSPSCHCRSRFGCAPPAHFIFWECVWQEGE